jgi:phenylalanine-4-hydroxylase
VISQQAIRDQLPEHLRQFVAEQDYATRYTARDQAVWRYVMRQLSAQLKTRAHSVYFEGLSRSGICVEHIPHIDEMNTCLQKIGWKAIVVDGFIPPQAFMELQALKVLAIALNMRCIDHIDYTPAPDIIHEAAGHAPIIADEEYSEYLQRFGEVGMHAMYNQWDLDVYEAVRELSIVKETFGEKVDGHMVRRAEQNLNELLDSPVEPSELALLTRLHWWTVEYGLVGDVRDCNIFGAGLLSSLEESRTCLGKKVQKIPLTTDAILTSYNITQPQPQLYVTKSCRHLTQVLEEYAATLCYRRGGATSVQVAIDSGVVTTCEYSSGLQVSGLFSRLMRSAIGTEIYIGTKGPTQLSVNNTELKAQGIEHHPQGFGSPVGSICNLMKPLEDASEYELQSLNIKRESKVRLEFISGITVTGRLTQIHKENGKIVLMSFSRCRVTGPAKECLFDPEWGDYDMAVGATIVSAYAGSADRSRFDVYPKAAGTSAHGDTRSQAVPTGKKVQAKVNTLFTTVYTSEEKHEFDLYQRVRSAREKKQFGQLKEIAEDALTTSPRAWILHLELLELILAWESQNNTIFDPIKTLLEKNLNRVSHANPKVARLIRRGKKLLGV